MRLDAGIPLRKNVFGFMFITVQGAGNYSRIVKIFVSSSRGVTDHKSHRLDTFLNQQKALLAIIFVFNL